MIELFAAAEGSLDLSEDQDIVPVVNEAGIESLSAILLDDEYYAIIKKNAVEKDGIYILNEMALIPFKGKAYLEITSLIWPLPFLQKKVKRSSRER